MVCYVLPMDIMFSSLCVRSFIRPSVCPASGKSIWCKFLVRRVRVVFDEVKVQSTRNSVKLTYYFLRIIFKKFDPEIKICSNQVLRYSLNQINE